ncbi:cell growth-regulating nucleolar protein [Acipenser oxyrinchus oxyrinchus]|uniref:Cell growth-regulating nucleolar protein n=1 Tax=Acipenser oxyrinchus oxyrinchus TaxID=40147 RepID=A0AAD8GJ47_ACIOX|nr:cell growth-regulating nucleolar protein [Acipenser oxyrinchus oxyrinchus]
MVFFTCNACGESIKKNQVEKHLNSCRNCQCLSCIDCGKDFWGDDYKNHLKCISEDQKYGGKGYAAKSNKGDVKQQQWIQRIHEAMNKPDINPKVRGILKEVSSYDNVPRKKARFQNWMKNSLKIFNTALHDQVWEIFSAATSNAPSQSELQPSTGGQPEEDHSKGDTPVTEDETSAKEKKKNKRERKEERQKKSKKEKKQLKLESQEEDGENSKTKKHKAENGATEGDAENGERKGKKNKKKVASVEVTRENGNDDRHETMTSSKKCKKRKHESSEDNPKSKHMKVEIAEEVECDSENKGKFSWKGTIQAVLKQSPEDEISIKKLRKKVLAEYYSVNGEDNHKSEEKLLSLFNKKISSNPKFRVLKDKVKLIK